MGQPAPEVPASNPGTTDLATFIAARGWPLWIFGQFEFESDMTDGVPDAAAIASLFDAAWGLPWAGPWNLFPSDGDVLGITMEALDLHEGVVSVMGLLGEQLGWIFDADVATFEAQLSAARALDRGEEASLPPRMGLAFDSRTEVPASLVERALLADWPVAADEAWPNRLAVGGEAGSLRALSARDFAVACLAFATMLLPRCLALRAIPDHDGAWLRKGKITANLRGRVACSGRARSSGRRGAAGHSACPGVRVPLAALP